MFQYILFFMAFIITCTSGYAFPMILVDKANHKIHFSSYENDKIKLLESYHVTTGKVVGDKVRFRDLKTPEGIYFFTNIYSAPNLAPKYGPKALVMDYPNFVDVLDGRKGANIWLHGTNEPERLVKDYDSEGCIVIDNTLMEKAINLVELNRSPIIVYEELKDEYLEPSNLGLKSFLDSWLASWNSKDIDKYIDKYSISFRGSGNMGRMAYKRYKKNLNKRYSYIKVQATEPKFYYHPKYSVIVFNQEYESNLFKSSGIKILYVRMEEGNYKILKEYMIKETF